MHGIGDGAAAAPGPAESGRADAAGAARLQLSATGQEDVSRLRGELSVSCCPNLEDASMRTLTAAVFAAALLVLPQAVEAHDAWANGDPIPPWVKTECCSQAHAHHIDDDAVHARPDGYHVDGYRWTIPYSQALPSPDGSTWLFYTTRQDGSQGAPYCFFVGPRGS